MSRKYQESGVSLTAGREFVKRLKPLAAKTHNPGVLEAVGGFAAAFDPSVFNFKDPILVASTDGVGTKLKLASILDRHEGIGIDLVAMSVNDILVCGAKPVFFLDYFAAGKLDVERGLKVIKGITTGCQMSGCALIGGETAEMPGMYHGEDYDLAGFCVGLVERGNQLGSHQVSVGDHIIGLASSGPHSNGYSLIRKLVTTPDGQRLNQDLFQNGSHQYLEQLIEPTKIYVKNILPLIESCHIRAMAHITGGGFFENIPRSLKEDQVAVIEKKRLHQPPLFQWLCELAHMSGDEPYHVWNMGTGFVLIVPPEHSSHTVQALKADGVEARVIGSVEKRKASSTTERVVLVDQAS